MNPILFSTYAVMALILMLTSAVFIVGLLRTEGHPAYKKWLLIYFSTVLFWQTMAFLYGNLHPAYLDVYYRYLALGFTPCHGILAVVGPQIAYTFPIAVFPRERKVVLYITSAIALAFLGADLWFNFISDQQHKTRADYDLFTNRVNGVVNFIAYSWSLLLWLRKAWYLRQQQSANALPCLLLALPYACIIGVSVLFIQLGYNHPLVYPIYFYTIWISVQYSVVIFIIYSTIPIRLKDKLIGLSFVTVMTLLFNIALIFFSFTRDIPTLLAQQAGLLKLNLVILAPAAFVLLVFPFILHISLIRPLQMLLNGIQQADQGDLTVQLPVTLLDEVGIVTQHFNRMTHSLKQSKDELIQHANTLEHRVKERTAELQKSLDHLKTTQSQLIQREKMAFLGEMTAGIAHEIQNPLNFVNNFSKLSVDLAVELREGPLQLLSDDGKNHADDLVSNLTQNLERVVQHGKRADGIVKSMLEHSRPSTGEKRPTDLNALLEEYWRLAYFGIRGKDKSFVVELVTNFDPDLGKVDVVPQDLGRVLLNVYNNALYALREKQQKAVSQAAGYQPTVRVRTTRANGFVQIQIEDNGTGMSDSVRKRIFQPFFTTKPAGQGTGLGLSLSFDIITKGHSGTLEAATQEGNGTVMSILLPA